MVSVAFRAATLAAAAGFAALCCYGTLRRRRRRPLVLAVCGVSSSGKSTVASLLARELNADADATALCQDDSFDYSKFETDSCPLRVMPDGRTWKDWESPDAISWLDFLSRTKAFIALHACRRVVVVEGFQLLARPESSSLFDAVVSIEITKGEAWKRRRGRALSMAHLPPGAGENTNYEVLEVYTREGDDRSRFASAAEAQYGNEGTLAWLRLYFEEVVWPSAQVQLDAVGNLPGTVPVLRLDGCKPEGAADWAKAKVPEVLQFVQSLRSARRSP